MVEVWRQVLFSLAGRLAAEPGRAHLAGGAVRDLLLDHVPRDIDLLIEADEAAETSFIQALASLSGMEPVLFDRRPPATRRVIIGGVVVDASICRPGGLRDALARRDFTINAMALPLAALPGELDETSGVSTGAMTTHEGARTRSRVPASLIDPFGGLADLEAGRLRAVTDGALDEDPLRMIRAVRLAAAFPGFAIVPELAGRMRTTARRVAEAAAERVQAEIELIFRSPRAGEALRRMDSYGLLAPLLPELTPLKGLRQPARHHDHDAFEHTLRAVEAADGLARGGAVDGVSALEAEAEVVLKWAALLHDAGKAATATVDGEGTPHFYGHEAVSAALAEDALKRLRAPSRIIEPVVKLIDLHLRLGALASAAADDRPVRRLVRAAGDLLPLLVLLSIADRRASGGEKASEREAALLDVCRRALSLRIEVEAASKAPPLLDGREIMSILGLPPGPRVGSIARWLERLRADGSLSTREEAETMLRSLPPARTRD